jgi:hypothetical protein
LPTTQYQTGKIVEAEGETDIDIKILLQMRIAWMIRGRGYSFAAVVASVCCFNSTSIYLSVHPERVAPSRIRGMLIA